MCINNNFIQRNSQLSFIYYFERKVLSLSTYHKCIDVLLLPPLKSTLLLIFWLHFKVGNTWDQPAGVPRLIPLCSLSVSGIRLWQFLLNPLSFMSLSDWAYSRTAPGWRILSAILSECSFAMHTPWGTVFYRFLSMFSINLGISLLKFVSLWNVVNRWILV